MTIDEIKELIQVVNESGIAELEVSRGDNRVRIRRSNSAAPQEIILPAGSGGASMAPSGVAAVPLNAPQAPPSSGGASAAGASAEDKAAYVKSPIVGTYYDSPAPGSPPFVKVGDRVSSGQVLCIIESMKLMNEIECEVSGVVTKKLVDNGRPVEYGEALFAIEPA